MITVGVRELKNKLSEYIRLVKAGEEILVTEHGEVVAELRQPNRSSVQEDESPFAPLIRAGLARGGGKNRPELYPRVRRIGREGLAKDLLDWTRGER